MKPINRREEHPLKTIGVTGGIGSGKSTVSAYMAGLGGYIMDADSINHENMRKGGLAYDEVIEAFGKGILDASGGISRKQLAGIVFDQPERLKKLMEITHRHVIEETRRRMIAVRENPEHYRFLVIDAPLLIEADMHLMCDAVCLVHAPEPLRLARVMARDGLTEEQVRERMARQTPFETLAAYAHYIIENDGHMERLYATIDGIVAEILGSL